MYPTLVRVVDVEDPNVFEALLNNERHNFKILNEKVGYDNC